MPFHIASLVSGAFGRVPDLPAGTNFVGQEGTDGKMMVLTSVTLPAKIGRILLTRELAETEAVKMGIDPASLVLWRV